MPQIYPEKKHRRFVRIPIYLRIFVVSHFMSISRLLLYKHIFIHRCSLWLTYGNLTNDNSICLVNTIGSMLFFFYTLVYYVFTVNKILLLKQFVIACCVLLCGLIYTNYETDAETAKQTIGKSEVE